MHRHERHRIAATDMPKQFHQEARQGRRQGYLGSLLRIVEHAQFGVSRRMRCENLTKLVGCRLLARGGQASTPQLFGVGWHGHRIFSPVRVCVYTIFEINATIEINETSASGSFLKGYISKSMLREPK